MRRWPCFLFLVVWLACSLGSPLAAQTSVAVPEGGDSALGEVDTRQTLVWGVFAYLGIEDTTEQYQPLAEYLQEALPEYRIELRVLPMDDILRGIHNGIFDFVSTNPTHFLVVRQLYPLSGVIATLVPLDGEGNPQPYLAGCIVVRADEENIRELQDVRGRRVATPSTQHMGGYRAQAYELAQAGVRLPEEVRLQETGTHQDAIRALMRGEVEVAFVRTGILEKMIEEGDLAPGAVRLLNPQNFPGFGLLTSTRLYPEWPLFALPRADPRAIRRVASALFSLSADHPAAQAARIDGFTFPADYLTVENLARTLRLPPFDTPPEVRLSDIWNKYRPFILGAMGAVVVMVLLAVGWFFASRRELANRRNYEAQLLAANEKLQITARSSEAANAAKSDFLANMSHEIRTPMNGVLGMLHLLMQSGLSPEQHRQAQTALSSGQSLLSLLNDILDFSKMEAGHLELENLPFDLPALLAEFTELFALSAQHKGVDFFCLPDPKLPRWVMGDASRIRQILTNLVGNAFKFTKSGQVVVRAYPEEISENRWLVRFSVEDTGVGIPADRVEALFQRFSQVDSSITRTFGGTGLGLAISKQLCHLMGGTIGVRSKLGRGSEFWFTLPLPTCEAPPSVSSEVVSPSSDPKPPLVECPPSSSPMDSSPVASSAHVSMPMAKPRILLVEDNSTNQLVASGLLRKIGCDPHVASSGAEALTMAGAQTYDLILMDVQMPEMDGYEATRRLREVHPSPHPPIVAMTAHAMQGDRERCLAAGMDDYLTKPVKPQALQAMMQKWISHYEPPSAS